MLDAWAVTSRGVLGCFARGLRVRCGATGWGGSRFEFCASWADDKRLPRGLGPWRGGVPGCRGAGDRGLMGSAGGGLAGWRARCAAALSVGWQSRPGVPEGPGPPALAVTVGARVAGACSALGRPGTAMAARARVHGAGGPIARPRGRRHHRLRFGLTLRKPPRTAGRRSWYARDKRAH
jgi:hypothetical protein